jgi:hypothetical protein
MAGKAYAVTRSDAEWRRILTPEQYDIMRSHGTEGAGELRLASGKATRQLFMRRLRPTRGKVQNICRSQLVLSPTNVVRHGGLRCLALGRSAG